MNCFADFKIGPEVVRKKIPIFFITKGRFKRLFSNEGEKVHQYILSLKCQHNEHLLWQMYYKQIYRCATVFSSMNKTTKNYDFFFFKFIKYICSDGSPWLYYDFSKIVKKSFW